MTEPFPATSAFRVLIVDDNRAIHQDFRKILCAQQTGPCPLTELEVALFGQKPQATSFSQLQVDSGYKGQEGLGLVESALRQGQPYALAFVDVRMPPGWDGIETASRLWKVDPDLQIVLCTAYSDQEWNQAIPRLGAGDSLLILKKPFDAVEVVQLANALSAKWSLTQASRRRMGALEDLVEARTRALKQANEELLAANQRAESSASAAQAASRAKSEFLATMSHEIRTPLNAVLGMLCLLREADLANREREFVQVAQSSAEILLGVINEILDFSKIEAGRMSCESVEFDLQEAVHELGRVFGAQAAAKDIQFNLDYAADVPVRVLGDPIRIRQVLTNLLANALKFTSSGHLRVLLRRQPDGQLRFSVLDSGIGIPPDRLKNLFQPFSQADTSTSRRYGGTGLGLAISAQLVKLMGGEIGVNSQVGSGSDFWFTLPLREPSPIRCALDSDPPRMAKARASVGNERDARSDHPRLDRQQFSARVLVVDDNSVNQKVGRLMLESLGCRVDVAGSGAEALERLGQSPYDLVFMDCEMPKMDGCQTTREIRRSQAGQPAIPIIALTAKAIQGDRERCLDAGMDDYISKPVRLEVLARALERWLPAAPRDLREPAAKPPVAHPGASAPGALDTAVTERLRGLASATNPALLGEIHQAFLSGAADYLSTIRQAAAETDVRGLSQAAHGLRGASANIGAVRLAELARQLEQAATSTPNSLQTPMVDSLHAEFAKVREIILVQFPGCSAELIQTR